MSGVATAIVGAAVVGAVVSSKSAKKGAKAATDAAEAQGRTLTAAQERAERLGQPFLDVGREGAEQLSSFLQDPNQQLEDNPVASFLRDQGFEQIQESAAARGRLGAGDTLQDLTRFNTGLAGTLQQQRFNQLFNVAGLGANVASGQGTAALQTGANIATTQGNIGTAQAQGIAGQAGAVTGTLQNLSGIAGAFPSLFGGGTPPPTSGAPASGGAPLNFGDLSFQQGAQSGSTAATF